jgi:lysozyme
MRFSRFAVFFALCAALQACGAKAPAPQRPAQDTPEAAQSFVAPPRFGDADPHEWDGRAPDAYPVHGIDASRWQGAIDWPVAQANGVSFAYFKATEGGDVKDPAFDAYWREAARHAIPRGAYHYFYFCRPAVEQARWFIRHVPRSKGALPPVLDMEWNAHSRTCRHRPNGRHVRAEAERFLSMLEAHYGQRPVSYTTVDFYSDAEMWKLSPKYEFWLRSVAGHPSKVYPGRRWTFWQYSGTGLVPGIEGKVDLNAFAGSERAWQDWLRGRRH